jgi:hypothetical protein
VFSSSLPFSAKPSASNWWQAAQKRESAKAALACQPSCGSFSSGFATLPSRRGGP